MKRLEPKIDEVHEVAQDDATVPNRRGLLRGAGLATAAALLGTGANLPAEAKDDGVVPAPVYFPTSYVPEVSLHGMNIVVTGASRGIGHAAALELVKAGAKVWGTSRTPLPYPAITEYPLLEFHLENPASIAAFVSAVGAVTKGRVDVLINNAGQFVFGGTTPTKPALFARFDSRLYQRRGYILGVLPALYFGQKGDRRFRQQPA